MFIYNILFWDLGFQVAMESPHISFTFFFDTSLAYVTSIGLLSLYILTLVTCNLL